MDRFRSEFVWRRVCARKNWHSEFKYFYVVQLVECMRRSVWLRKYTSQKWRTRGLEAGFSSSGGKLSLQNSVEETFLFDWYEYWLCRSKHSPAGLFTADPTFSAFLWITRFLRRKLEKITSQLPQLFYDFVSTNSHYERSKNKEKNMITVPLRKELVLNVVMLLVIEFVKLYS